MADNMPYVPTVTRHPVLSPNDAAPVVRELTAKCTGNRFVSNISGRTYPRVEWWNAAGAALGLFPVEIRNVRQVVDDPTEIRYEAIVEIRSGETVVTRGSAICTNKEKNWKGRDEYAIRSMAATRATGKAYRLGLSFLAVLANLEPTPAEEIPQPDSGHSRAGGVGGGHPSPSGKMYREPSKQGNPPDDFQAKADRVYADIAKGRK